MSSHHTGPIMKNSIFRTLLLSIFLAAISGNALAQYVWIDDKGVKQFSDQPPPPDTPKNRILKFSGKALDAGGSDAADDSQPAAKAAPTLAEQELAFKKRQQASAAQAKKSEEAAKQATIKADNCARSREYKQSLDSGMRIAQTDPTGARVYMSDEKRAQEQAAVSQQLADCN